MYRSHDYHCEDCGLDIIEIFKKGEQPDTLDCIECGGLMRIRMGVPTPLRASLADGQRRGDRWELAKTAAKLEQQAAYTGDPKEKARIKQEAKRVSKIASTKSDITDK